MTFIPQPTMATAASSLPDSDDGVDVPSQNAAPGTGPEAPPVRAMAVELLPAAQQAVLGSAAVRSASNGGAVQSSVDHLAAVTQSSGQTTVAPSSMATAMPVLPAAGALQAYWNRTQREAGKEPAVDARGRHSGKSRLRRRFRGFENFDDESSDFDIDVFNDELIEAVPYSSAEAEGDDPNVPWLPEGLIVALRRLARDEPTVAEGVQELDEGRRLVIVTPLGMPRELCAAASVHVVSLDGAQRGRFTDLDAEVAWRVLPRGRLFALAHFVVSRPARWRWSIEAMPDAAGREPIALCLGGRAPCGAGQQAVLRIPRSTSFLEALGTQRAVRVLLAGRPIKASRPSMPREVSSSC